jgi:hypothetical protein
MGSLRELLEELEALTGNMAALHKELAEVQSAETRGRLEHQQWSEETTVTGRKSYADYQVIDLSVDRIKIQGELAALRERKDFLLTAIGVHRGRRES